jgi:LysM repeat protein
MRFTTTAIALAALASSAYAHMEMTNPIPFRSKLNKNTPEGNKDFSMTTPLSGSGSDFPCKGYLKDLGTPGGVSTASWAPGSAQKLGITGGAAHNGGSCQLSLSYDGGKTFKVIKSLEGGCVNPAGGDQTFDFTVPADAKAGDAVFAWTWFNHTGNREMYMNCAAVTITGSGTNDLSSNPDMFVANVGDKGNGCGTTGETDLKFPNPGADVVTDPTAKLAPPEKCTGGAAAASPPPAASSAAAPPAAGSSAAVPPAAGSSAAVPPAAGSSAAVPPAAGSSAAVSSAAGSSAAVSSAVSSAAAPAATSSAAVPPTDVPAKAAPVSGSSGSTYTVKSGDICTTIAAQNGMTVDQLLKNNPTINSGCSNLVVGQPISLRRRSRIMRDYY